MSFSLPIIGDIIKGVTETIDNLHTSDEEELKIELQSKVLDVQVIHDQLNLYREEAKHPSVFVAGARPAVIWMGVLGFGYNFMLHGFMEWGFALAQALEWIPYSICVVQEVVQEAEQTCEVIKVVPPPKADTSQLMALATFSGGIGIARSFDKMQGTETSHVG